MSKSRTYPQRRPLGHGRVAAGAAPVKPRDAGSLIIWRTGAEGAEVLMGRRSRKAAFVPDFFVFPGGSCASHFGTDGANASRGYCLEPGKGNGRPTLFTETVRPVVDTLQRRVDFPERFSVASV